MGVAPLLVALRAVGPGAALGLAWLWHLAYSFAIGDWLVGGIAFYFEQSTAFALLCFVAMTSVMVAPYYLVFALLYRGLARRYRAALPWLAAAAWTASELARGRLFTGTPFFIGNPWALLGYSQAQVAPLAQLASLTGVYGISFVLVLVNAALAEAALHAWRGSFAPGRELRRLGAAAVPALAAWGFGAAVLASAPPPGSGADGTRVAVVQGHIGLAERWHQYFQGRNLRTYLTLTNQVLLDESKDGARGVEVVFWPEAAMTFLLDEQPGFHEAIGRLLRAREVQLVAGIPRRQDGGGYYNSVYLFSEEADVLTRYDKQYLLPFAEYLPLGLEALRDRFGRFPAFDHGGPAALLPTRAGRAGILVCNEAVLPEVARARVRAGAEYLVNPANDSWSRDPKFTGQWFDIIWFRAIEQRRTLVRASTSGPSAVVDPWGRVLASTGTYARGAAVGPVLARSDLSVYARVGDLFALACAAAALGALAARRRRPVTGPPDAVP